MPYADAWPAQFEQVAAVVWTALGDRVLALEHVGSTGVPGLAAKPVIDVDLTVRDPDDEASYVPDLEAVRFGLRIRQPDWEQHRLLVDVELGTHLHVFPPSAGEPARHVAFRDWLRGTEADRLAYGRLKTELAGRGFTDGMAYNNHKAALVYDIYERIFSADPAHPHTPRPRGAAQNA